MSTHNEHKRGGATKGGGVFDTMAQSAAELSDEEVAAEYREDGEQLDVVASRVRGTILSARTNNSSNGIRGAMADVAEFHKTLGDKSLSNADGRHAPMLRNKTTRFALLEEEFKELRDAYMEDSVSAAADAYADMIYILLGSAYVHIGAERFARVWDEVHRSNMAKFPGGVALRREDGKVLKPEGWEPPDIYSALNGTPRGWRAMTGVLGITTTTLTPEATGAHLQSLYAEALARAEAAEAEVKRLQGIIDEMEDTPRTPATQGSLTWEP